jgi:Spy/CpxP family protein refolding chaperone
MMRHGRSVKALVLSLGLVVTSAGLAAAQGPGGPPMGGQWGGMGGYTDGWRLPLMLRGARLTPDQQARVREILAAHRPTLRSLTDQLRQAQDEVADRLFAAGAVQGADLQPALQRIGQLRDQLLQESAQAAMEVRALLTPDQLAQAAAVKARMAALRTEMRQLLQPDRP